MKIFKLADKVRGKFTGATGTVVAITYWIDGSISYTVQPKRLTNGGSPVNIFTVREYYLEKVEG